MEFESVIGLEVHAELLTKTKIYCGCTTEFGGKANTHVCPICLGLPGSLPQLNKQVVELGIKAGLALNCEITKVGRMDRKNYFYPDCPKNYQITQDELPLCRNGYIDIELESGEIKRIGIERIHIEEDAGKLLHTKRGTLVDFNRAGVPLIEVVSKPDIRTSEEATLYLTKLKSILSSCKVSDCKMEEGSLRCDANISIREKGTEPFGIRSEIKNMNSFKAVEKALHYEFERQVKAVTAGEKLTVETRRWDETNNETTVMRSKEEANDYRYFPEGDLVTLNISDEWIENVRKTIPELPHEKEARFIKEYELPKYDAHVLTLTDSMAEFFDEAAKLSKDPKAASNWIMGDLSRLMNVEGTWVEDLKFAPNGIAELIEVIKDGTISSAIGKQVLEAMFESGKLPKAIIEEKGLKQNNDEGAILEIVNKVLDENPQVIEQYKSGKTRILGFAVGQVMKATKGQANPGIVNQLVEQEVAKR
ncbi:Asp-tRNA(Asn)/Glu-tRNA(Gln) amidotransferase subunit GatB [Clostridium saccharobutylicum]|uniref:Aspartyl/glutamyl-tRNA(Asn/Gln) amidotransferase subunit B n=1 Tax=Clostridium saccharobutylicum DSM 13864 TaxID=1345695 RepID=U5MP60_CLOSA|nr:Asp-tRNA(Asn)/Glu-tRNA(Gln) amidotransferase subunit GatB [Clostridium saccharobutylicum]AGX41436.1 aspartyl/glutamyl-tRNA(Asn/Gln) amidotransferase subunit B [Clostridium saccharobutylicum DSM 13864]AQR88717.1 aspartyl/glutamyl-tRNA(Asn/Gln) amidotransferase subunit B [Clostridium saccharobutylicum]AQR98615.1 aspartyl/glutamyl-tRNA(Asn/Gln) amidotransferase subunit B [Clostridium saccharobutylicum]AQS08336.1 aspartyl/glutamyl-tRNA(Asn/Gln) amidotransferase subunit B [Clostridium saccharobut